MVYPWGMSSPLQPVHLARPARARGKFWEGQFLDKNTSANGFYYAAPVGSFAPNGYGIVDMAGNVRESFAV